jgi:signal transduction histidine kinase
MATMAVSLLLLVGGFFWFVDSSGGESIEALVEAYARSVATTSPSLAEAIDLKERRPLRALSDAVARLGAGDLDVTLPSGRHDEFGKLTAAFNHMVGRVREMILARDQLLLDVSHELRSPVTRMKVAIELLPQDDHRRGLAADIVEMEVLIAELLELERLRGGRGVTAVPQDLVPIVREVTTSFRGRAPGVSVTSTPPSLMLNADGEKIRTVLRNLLENALKNSAPESLRVEVSVAQEGDHAVIRVTDHGVGIPEGDRERIFEPFFRVDRSRTKSTGGFGLGLSIAKRIVEAHAGTIAASSVLGTGTTFTVSLPRVVPISDAVARAS